MANKGWLLLALAATLYGGWSWMQYRPIHRPDGVIAPADPAQTNFDSPQTPIPFKDAALQPLASFALTARVLSRDDYHFDAESDLSPTDLAFGWGRMSDSAVLRAITIDQGGRFYSWQVRSFPIPRREIETHSANMHMIPADARVARALKRVRVGDVVTLEGVLVEADKPGGWRWRSSLTRDDVGDGACEVVYVRDLTIAPR
ncbi:MAG TPA: hypothetical protein VN725_08910 [Rhodanobacteraceae bacterium]|nr:hypothetical protein [Rhodanobacteraceae bacterium]